MWKVVESMWQVVESIWNDVESMWNDVESMGECMESMIEYMESMGECMDSIVEYMESIAEYMEQKHSTWNPPGMWGQGKVLTEGLGFSMDAAPPWIASAPFRKTRLVVQKLPRLLDITW